MIDEKDKKKIMQISLDVSINHNNVLGCCVIGMMLQDRSDMTYCAASSCLIRQAIDAGLVEGHENKTCLRSHYNNDKKQLRIDLKKIKKELGDNDQKST